MSLVTPPPSGSSSRFFRGVRAATNIVNSLANSPAGRRLLSQGAEEVGKFVKRKRDDMGKERKTKKAKTKSKSKSHKGVSLGEYKAGVKKLKAKGVKIKKVKVMKISKKFKKMVQKVQEEPEVKGTWQVTHSGGYVPSKINVNEQYAWTGNHTNWDASLNFTTDHFLTAASILFNNRNPTVGTGQYDPNQPGQFSALNTKVKVINSYGIYRLKNNSQRVLSLEVYECKPSKVGSYVNAVGGNGWKNVAGVITSTALTDPLSTPENEWNSALADDFASGAVRQSLSGPAALTTSTLHNKPGYTFSLKKRWKCSKIESIKLEPGQDTSFKVQGPQEMMLNYERFWEDLWYRNIQKFTRGIMFIMRADLCGSTLGGGGRFPDANFGPNCLVIEREDHYKIVAPEITNFNLKFDKIVVDQRSNVATVGSALDVEENNPTTIVST